MMSDQSGKTGWVRKFRNAFRGIALGMRGESSFHVHLPMAVAVIGVALLLQIETARFCILLLCIAVVISAELFNSSLERLARAITTDHDNHVGAALDIASGAVLLASIGSSTVGVILLLTPLLDLLSGI